MTFDLVPGFGDGCTTANGSIERAVLQKPIHFHLNTDGTVIAYEGAGTECPEFRKARALVELSTPKRRSM